ncbi:putative cinnamyl alcohol dehydrogenase 6 [Ananas comosus]|uniref:cinnamyl-alcohol dehydrogenase n=1 Tax=Ananas comosus TaxID=4615 RepID=A0A199VSR9_ANACO|nr:putative cinnamyl alcohol dehydrogenase 6 [Ananas comosus]
MGPGRMEWTMHEITGVITKVGANVRNFKVGDRVGVGCLAASCLNCEHCDQSEENYCEQAQFTYNGIFWDGSVTYGGYSEMLVADKRFVVHVPNNLPLDAVAPLLCAGITVFSPMKRHNMLEAGKKLGVVGLGGLGHVAVKFGKAFGLQVTVISTSPSKEKEARELLGADNFIVSTDPEAMQAGSRSLDYVIDTVAAKHSLGPILELLKVNGKLVLVGAPEKPLDLPSFPLIFGKRVVSGSIIGGIKETQEMMDLCGEHNITCNIELIKPDYINDALDRLANNDILYCGMCHTDLHHVRNDWGITMYPVVPGHEITGVITKVGSNVANFKVGDRVGVGCLAASCLECEHCKQSEENYCAQVQFTYNGIFWDGSITYGGYSEMLVADKRFVVRVPDDLPLDVAAPLLCGGITVFSPMKQHNMLEFGKRLGVVGLGGLGHIAVKFGKAFGLHVTVISTSPSKEKEAKERLGADNFIVSTDPEAMRAGSRTLDYIIDTVSAKHSLGPILELLKVNGKLAFVGAPDEPVELPSFPLIFGKRVVSGSLIGGMKETQEMMDLCAKHNITCDIELIKPDYINQALNRLAKNDVRYRFVIDFTA